jgi:alkyl hydroperoxide reductase subunit AhpC
VILFSHPEDYTPVCTTELAALAKHEPEFTKRHVKLIGLSANSIESHDGWINDITEIAGCPLTFPVIGDKDRLIAYTYDMSVASYLPFRASTYAPQLQTDAYEQAGSPRYH